MLGVRDRKRAVSRIIAAVIIIVLVAIAAGAGVLLTSNHSSSTSSSTASTSSSSSSSSASSSSSSQATSGGSIVINDACCIDTLDPAITVSTQGPAVQAQIYQGLVEYQGNSTTKLVPVLAQNYTENPNGLSYNFTLRQNITFSNGDPFNAYVMWYSYYRATVMAGYPGSLLSSGLNMSGVTAAELNSFNSTNNLPPSSLMQVMQNPNLAVTATGPYSLAFHLAQPWAAFLAFSTFTEGYAVDPYVIAHNGGVVTGQVNTWMTNNAMGTGPFVLTTYVANQEVVLNKNSHYWGGANGVQPTPHLDQITVQYSTTSQTRLEDVQKNTSQLSLIDLDQVSQISGNPNLYIPSIGIIPTVAAIGMDNAKAPFNNTLVREAAEHAINYTEVLNVFDGFAVRANGPIPQGMLGYATNVPPYSYNVTLAEQLLTQAGYPGGKGLPSVTLIAVTDDPPSPQIDTVVAANLAVIGINVQINTMNYATEANLLADPGNSSAYPDMPYQIWFFQTDPWSYALLVSPYAYGTANYAYYNNTQVNSLVNQAAFTTNSTERSILYQQVAQLVYNDAPYIWIGQEQNYLADGVPVLSSNLHGFFYNADSFVEGDWSTLYLSG